MRSVLFCSNQSPSFGVEFAGKSISLVSNKNVLTNPLSSSNTGQEKLTEDGESVGDTDGGEALAEAEGLGDTLALTEELGVLEAVLSESFFTSAATIPLIPPTKIASVAQTSKASLCRRKNL